MTYWRNFANFALNPPSDSLWTQEQPWIFFLMATNKELSPEEIASSWNGKFHDEKAIDACENHEEVAGLRAPQIGALPSILAQLNVARMKLDNNYACGL